MSSRENTSDRECPFCGGQSQRTFGERLGVRYVRCNRCRAIYMDISMAQFARLHESSFQDETFVADVHAFIGDQPNERAWREFAQVLRDGSVLEIGPGTGHVLAAARAAGREVAGVESSVVHRRFIQQRWGIEQVVATLGELPAGKRYDNVIMVNVLEHVYDVVGMMQELRSHLSTGARVFISTVNAEGVTGTLARTYWAMFKPRDHVSFPSLASLSELAERAGYTLTRRWSAELPLETPIGLLVAMRDFVREHGAARPQGDAQTPGAPGPSTGRDSRRDRTRRVLSAIYKRAERIDPSRRITGALGRAATVKGVFVPLVT